MVFLSMSPRPGVTVVAVDNRGGARQAMQHLIGQGRKCIGNLTGPLAWWKPGNDMRVGRPPCSRAVWSRATRWRWSATGRHRPESAPCRNCCGRSRASTPCLPGSDQIALGALGALSPRAARVPSDVAVVGFDDMPEAQYFRPPLTTVHQKLVEVGRSAVAAAAPTDRKPRQASHRDEGAVTLMAPELVLRASSA